MSNWLKWLKYNDIETLTMQSQRGWQKVKIFLNLTKKFDCLVYAHIPDHLKKKLDDQTEKFFLLAIIIRLWGTNNSIQT